MMSTSACPTPTVSRNTSSLPDASMGSAACRVASLSPPSEPRLGIERMKTPGSRKCSVSLIRSPSSAPCVNGDDGSIESTATSRSLLRACATRRPISVDLPTPGGPVNPTTAALPVFGYTSRTSAQPSGSSSSTSEIARASARLSPSSRGSTKSAAVRRGMARECTGYEIRMGDGAVDNAKGNLKEAAGDLTGDKSLENEGKVDQAPGTVKDKVGDAADKAKDVVGKD